MSVKQLYESGYRDLVSVVPPDAKLAPTTGLRLEVRGKAPGKQRLDGTWVGYNFMDADGPTPRDVIQWEQWGANVGLHAKHFPGLDVDVDHPQLAELVVQEARKVLGDAPVRSSRPPRKLLVYHTNEPFSRLACDITYRGEEHTVEMLGRDRQYLVLGDHPSGEKYTWEGVPLWEWDPESLSTVTADDVQDFYEHLADLLDGRAQVTIDNGGDTEDSAKTAPPQDKLEAPSQDKLADVVEQIPNRFPDREDYIRVGHAIKAAGGEEAFDIWWDWCQRWEGGDNERETVEADWNRMHAPFRVGWDYLQELASEMAGYEPAQDAFDADQSAEDLRLPEEPRERPAEEPGETYTIDFPGVREFTDTWVVSQIAGRLAKRLRFVPETDHWHVWNGVAWAQDRRNRAEFVIRRELVRLSSAVRKQAQRLGEDDPQAKQAKKMAFQLQQRGALTKVVPELQAHPKITLTVEDFDDDDWILNTPDGIINLRTGDMQESDPDALCSKTTAVGPKATRPVRWLRFLDEATGGDMALQQYLQRLAGYSLTGSTQEQTLTFIHGPTETGKSTFLDTLAGVFGGYHETAAADTFASSRSRGVPADVAALAGARLVTASETQEGRSWDTQRVKQLTGGDEVSARFLYQNFFSYKPRYQIVIVGNHEPEVEGVDDAIMRRLHIVPFENKPDNVDRLLSEKLKDEWPGILHWAIQGCQMWLEEGLNPPRTVLKRTEEYAEEEDIVGSFIQERCILGEGSSVSRHRLYEAWRRWCSKQGEDPGTKKQMRRRFRPKAQEYDLKDTRIEEGGKYRRGYEGIGLRDSAEEVFETV